jgi:lipid-A-disaccharide synthase
MSDDSPFVSTTAQHTGPLIYLIAGESSGDLLGARLMQALKKQTNGTVRFAGIGGPRMQAEGLESLFPFHDLSLMGFVEIIPHLSLLYKRFRQTISHITHSQPDAVITIDSPGFTFRIAKKLREQSSTKHLKLIHYVAPTVWAYKAKRAEKVSKLYDFLLLVLPFEPPYFDAVELPNRFVGHPVVRDWREFRGNGRAFREKHGILPNAPLLTLLPGSRKTEIARLLPVYQETVDLLLQNHPNLSVVLVVPPHLENAVEEATQQWPGLHILSADPEEKRDIFAASTVALAKSGTVTLELSLAHVPLVVTYKVSPHSAWLMRRMIRVPYVNLVNLLLDRPVIPEYLQENCRPSLLSKAISELLRSPEARKSQLEDAAKALQQLDDETSPQTPSEKAAETILELVATATAPISP